MKLIIQIPCYNEAVTLPQTLLELPREIDGVDMIEVLVIDDGSTDGTSEVALRCGVGHIVRLPRNRGLAAAFALGLDASVKRGADIIVNTDADNQYRGADVEKLVQPILQKKANIVVGTRSIDEIQEFSAFKKFLQRTGSLFVRGVSKTTVPDVTSGFRAYDREAAMRLNVFSNFTYTLETLIQAESCGLKIDHVPVRTNQALRQSRLFSSASQYVSKSLATILRTYTMYRPLRVFAALASVFIVLSVLLLSRFIYFYVALSPSPTGHVQSLIVGGIFAVIGFQIVLFGVLADLTAKNRRLLEETLFKIKKYELDRILENGNA